MDTLLFATDGSDMAKRAGLMTCELMEAWPAARLVVLHVIPEIIPDSVYPTFAVFPREVARENALAAEIEQAARTEVFSQFVDRMEVRIEIGVPVDTICAVAESENAGLIVLGSHGRNVVNRIVLGSVSHGVVQHSKIPVLVVK